jgi:hypothetical protein
MPALYKSKPIMIGKHEWRVIVTPFHLGGNCLEYQWRPANANGTAIGSREFWRCSKDWPRWNGNDTYCGLPKTLDKLYYREIRELDKHLCRVAPIAPQMELFAA